MERKLRISHKSFERLTERFLRSFVKPYVYDQKRIGRGKRDVYGNIYRSMSFEGIQKEADRLIKGYKSSPFRNNSGYSHDLTIFNMDKYKISYKFTDNDTRIHFKLHIRSSGGSRNKRVAIMTIRLNESK